MGTTGQIEVLNDLIKINEEHIQAYQRIVSGPYQKISRLLSDLNKIKAVNVLQLREELRKTGGRTCDSLSGSIYSKWKALNIRMIGSDLPELMKSAEYAERAIIDAYQSALGNTILNAAQRFTLRKQYDELLNAVSKFQQFGLQAPVPLSSYGSFTGSLKSAAL